MAFIIKYWDILALALFVIFHYLGWYSIKQKLAQDPHCSREEREFAGTILLSACVAGITAVSILIPASVLIIQTAITPQSTIPQQILPMVFRASLWFLISLIIGLYTIFIIPLRVHKFDGPVKSRLSKKALLEPIIPGCYFRQFNLVIMGSFHPKSLYDTSNGRNSL